MHGLKFCSAAPRIYNGGWDGATCDFSLNTLTVDARYNCERECLLRIPTLILSLHSVPPLTPMGGDTIHVGFLDGNEYIVCYSQNCFGTKVV